jgi:hypothetical protein
MVAIAQLTGGGFMIMGGLALLIGLFGLLTA